MDIVRETADVCDWVLQQYISNPMTIQGGRKFHLRAYVVAVGSLDLFVFDDLLAHVAARPYDLTNDSELGMLGHITNLAFGKKDPEGYDVTKHMRPWFEDCVTNGEVSMENATLVFDR